jgi:hypothetical protein
MITDNVQYTDFHDDNNDDDGKFRLKNLTTYWKRKDTNPLKSVKTEREKKIY